MTKQLFLYVSVEFETMHNRFNQMVMWSHTITSKASCSSHGADRDLPVSLVHRDVWLC